MKYFLMLTQITFFTLVNVAANSQFASVNSSIKPEIKILDLKIKKELSDKKLSSQKKYVIAILSARELRLANEQEKALEYYKLANDLKVDFNKNEVSIALSKNQSENNSLFFYEINLKQLLKNKSYDKALLSFNPDQLSKKENQSYRIIYDLLNVRIRKNAVKKLYCLDDLQKSPEEYQYTILLCDMLNDFIREGKIANFHMKLLEEYFFKHDLSERYLLQLARDLKSSL